MQSSTQSAASSAAPDASETDVMLASKVTATVLPNGVWPPSLLRHTSAIFPNFLPRLIRADVRHFGRRG